MTEILLHFSVSKDVELEETARLIEEHLSHLEIIEEVEAAPEEARLTGVELAAMIAVAVIVVRSSRELVEELRKLVPEIQGLIRDIQGLEDVFVEVGAERVPISQLTNEQLQKLVA